RRLAEQPGSLRHNGFAQDTVLPMNRVRGAAMGVIYSGRAAAGYYNRYRIMRTIRVSVSVDSDQAEKSVPAGRRERGFGSGRKINVQLEGRGDSKRSLLAERSSRSDC
ncbi:hypothetical protein DWB58_31610, partial [candidate division KSB1 bacterium]|nr:hypothetical protein [candidate division KSB1 bacterium]